MRSLCRFSLAAMIFAAATTVAFAQDPSAEPSAQPAPAVTPAPVPDLPVAAPVESQSAQPAPQEAQQPEAAPAPEAVPAPQPPPVAAAPAQSSASSATTETKTVHQKKRVSQPAAPKVKPEAAPVEAPKTDTTDAAAAAAGTAAGTTDTTNLPPSNGEPAPAGAVGNQAPPLPPPEVANTKAQETAETKTNTGASGWVVLGIVALAAVGIYLLMSRRRKEESLSIYNRDLSSAHTITGTIRTTSRPGPPVTHRL